MKNWIQSTFLLFALSFFTPVVYAIVGPVVPGQAIWCIDQRIASNLDIINSEIANIDLNFSQLEQILTSQISSIISASQAPLSVESVILSELALLEGCLSIPITGPTTITAQGVYCLNNNIVGAIVVQASDVMIGLNSFRVTGNISIGSNQSRITVHSGVVDNNNAQGTGILVNAGTTDINFVDVTIKNAQIGINGTQVTNAIIKNCTLTQNTTGVQLNSAHNVVIDSTVAVSNNNAGFDLITSTSCLMINCQALGTGSGNTTKVNNTVIGFAATSGSGNVFERCIANATQALSTTDFSSVVAGIAFRGTEKSGKIINCEASNSTVSSSGVTVPFGILLQPTVNTNFLFATAQLFFTNSSSYPLSVSWSPDGRFFTTAEGNPFVTNGQQLFVYQFNRVQASIVQLASINIRTSVKIASVSWSPSGNYIALTESVSGTVYIYYFETLNNTLTQIAAVSLTSGNPVSLSWSSNNKFLAVADNARSIIVVYQFDPVALTLTSFASQSVSVVPVSIRWSPDVTYVAVAETTGVSTNTGLVEVYSFNQGAATLTKVASSVFSNPVGVSWSPNGLYIAVVNDNSFAQTFLTFGTAVILGFNRTTFALTTLATSTPVGDLYYPLSVTWSPDSKYIAVPANPNGFGVIGSAIIVYLFDPGSLTLTYVSALDEDDVYFSDWSPDGDYIIVAINQPSSEDIGQIMILPILFFPFDHVITGNVAYCNSGGITPQGVGISGSSIDNYIVGNVAYSNPCPPFAGISSNYIFVQNVFNQLFGQAPSLLQNIALGCREPVLQPDYLALLLKQIANTTTTIGCTQTVLNSQSISSGTISITASGAYCMAQDLTANMVISTTCANINMNNRILYGTITVQTAQDVSLFSGRVEPPAPTSSGQASTAAITIGPTALGTQISGLTIICADTTTNAINGRLGIQILDSNASINSCFIKSGAGAANTSGVGGSGGIGILLSAGGNNALVQKCIIRTGSGGNGTTQGGNGGDGISISSGVTQAKIIGCTILQLGAPGLPLGTTAPQGGNGLTINAGAINTLVNGCVIRNSTAGVGTLSTGGLAVDNRAVTTKASVVYGNVAYNIGSSVNFSNLSLTSGSVLDEFGVQLDDPPSNNPLNIVANVFFSPLA